MPTFNGWTILNPPSYPPCPATLEWQANDNIGVTENPFTRQQLTQDQNASWLEASASWQPMSNKQAIAWCAWMMSLRGQLCAFQLGDPLNLGPQNSAAVAPTVSGANQTGYSLVTTGGSNMTVGDWIQLGYRAYRITSIAGGTLGIWPQIRESPANSATTSLTNVQILWKLKTNVRKWSVSRVKLYGIQLELREAL